MAREAHRREVASAHARAAAWIVVSSLRARMIMSLKNDDRGDLQPFAEDQNLESARRLVNRFRKKVFVDIHTPRAIRNVRVTALRPCAHGPHLQVP